MRQPRGLHRVRPCALGLAAVLAAARPGGASPAQAGVGVTPGEGSVGVDYVLPAFSLTTAAQPSAVAGRRPAQIRVEGLALPGIPGQPDLPTQGLFLALPPGASASARLEIEEASFHELTGVWLDPPATPVRDLDGGADGGDPAGTLAGYAAVPDPELYGRDAFFPEAPAAIVYRGVMRDVDFVKVEIDPFRWNPVSRTLRVHDRIRFRVDYDPGPAGAIDAGPAGASQAGASNAARSRGARARAGHGMEGHGIAEHGTGPSIAAAESGPFANRPVPASWHVRRVAEGFQASLDSANPAANGEAWKLSVSADGIHRLSFESLVAAGFPAPPAAFTDLKLELRGSLVPLAAIDADKDGLFGPGDALEFYGYENRERWTPVNVYWLTRGGGGRAVTELPALPAAASTWPTVKSSLATVHSEKNDIIYPYTLLDLSVWEPWLNGYSLKTGGTSGGCRGTTPALDVDIATPLLTAARTGAVYQLRGRILGRLVGTCNPDDQEVDVALNGQPVGPVAWKASRDGALKTWSFDIDPRLLAAGSNRVTLSQPYLPGTLRWSHLDWLELDYERELVASGDRIEIAGTWPQGAVLYVRGLSSSRIEVVDVRSDGRVDRLSGVKTISLGPGQPVTASFAVAPEAGVSHRLAVSTRGALLAPAVVRDTPSDLRAPATRASYLAIAHPSFLAATQELVDYRASRGLSARLIDVQDVYDEFSYGNVDARAIRDFLAYALTTWDEPHYVLLVGDTTQDFRNYWQAAESPFFLPHLEYVAVGGGAVIGEIINGDSLYQTLIGNDPVPDLVLGRLAVQSAAEVSGYVAKVKAYEATPGGDAWNRRYLTVVDDNIETSDDTTCPTAMGSAETFVVHKTDCYIGPPATTPDHVRVLEKDYGWPGGRDVILDNLEQGVSLMLYYGHGSSETFGLKCPSTSGLNPILQADDLATLVNAPMLPLGASLSCNVAAFDWFYAPAERSRCFAETMVLGSSHGFAAFIGSTNTIGETEGRGEIDGILDGLFRPGSTYLPSFLPDPRRAGAIHFAGQTGFLLNARVPSKLRLEFDMRTLSLQGDPALELRITPPPAPPSGPCPD